MPYVCIEGNIGAGKSTLLHKLGASLGWEIVEEGIEFDPDFQIMLKRRLLDPTPENIGDFQLYIASFMADRIAALDPNKYYLVERSVSATQMFALAAGLPNIIDALAGHVLRVPAPEFFVYLGVDPETCLERTRKRARDGESEYTLDYLQLLHSIHERWFADASVLNRAIRIEDNHDDAVKIMTETIKQKVLN